MELLINTGAMNVGVIALGAIANIAIHKWNRGKLKLRFEAIIEKLIKHGESLDEIKQNSSTLTEINVSVSPKTEAEEMENRENEPNEPIETPSESKYVKPYNPKRFFFH